MGIALGVGLTNKCNCNCPHCYSREGKTDFLDVDKLFSLCEMSEIDSVNFGTGESIFHPRFIECLSFFSKKNIPMSLTTNGYTADHLTDEQLALFNDIDVSLDFPLENLHDNFRENGQFKKVLNTITRCKKNNVDCSVALCLMNTNYMYLPQMLGFCRSEGINLRINIYKPVHTDKFTLTYEEFWTSIAELMNTAELISCSEPIVCLAIQNGPDKESYRAPCGSHSLRIKPSGYVVPCVYMLDETLHIDQLIQCAKEKKGMQEIFAKCSCEVYDHPEECASCDYLKQCGGGCVSRRLLMGGNRPDSYCFVQRKENIKLYPKWVDSPIKLVHSDYLCTLIVR